MKNSLYVVYLVIPEEGPEYVETPPEFDFAGCIDYENHGVMQCWSFLTFEEAAEARKLAWDYCKNRAPFGFVDMGIRYTNGDENVEATMDMQDELEDKLAELVSDVTMEKATGCIDIAMRSLLKAAILDLNTPREIFDATVKELYDSVQDEDEGTPPRLLH